MHITTKNKALLVFVALSESNKEKILEKFSNYNISVYFFLSQLQVANTG